MIAVARLALLIATGRFLIQWHEWRAYQQGLAAERVALAALRAWVERADTSESRAPAPSLTPSVPK
jgi:hypothetical protein